MEYPLILGGETRGRVNVSREGLYTVVSASAESTGELTRLWLCGEGASFYLGVMREENGRPQKYHFRLQQKKRSKKAP